MGGFITLTACDDHRLGAYVAEPSSGVRGGLVVVQEAFGVNDYVRAVADGFAEAGYRAIAPALYDRQRPDATLGYDAADIAVARRLRANLVWSDVLKDIDTAARHVGAAGRVGIVGYCVGGSVAWIAAQNLKFSAMVSYYGRDIVAFLARSPQCPAMLHFGERDAHIPLDDVDAIREAFPELPIYLYPAEHGFDCDRRPSYDAVAATAARRLTLALFRKFVG